MSTSQHPDEEATWTTFFKALETGQVGRLPNHTSRQAVTHFLATRPLHDLSALIEASAKAPIWDEPADSSGPSTVKQCFQDAVQLKVQRETDVTQHSLFKGLKRRRAVREWLSTVNDALCSIKPDFKLSSKAGLLSGLSRTSLHAELSKIQAHIEDEIVMAVGVMLQAEEQEGSQELNLCGMLNVCEAVVELSASKVQLLADLGLRDALRKSMFPVNLAHKPLNPLFAQALAQTFRSSCSQSSSKGKERAWNGMTEFARRFRSAAAEKMGDKAAGALLHDHLTVASVIIDEMAFATPPQFDGTTWRTRPFRIATDLFLSLAELQWLDRTDDPLIRVPHYEEVLYGLIDIITATGSEKDIVDILDQMSALPNLGNIDVFILQANEQLLTKLGLSDIRDKVLPKCRRHLGQGSNGSGVEAAHSVMLSVLARCQLLGKDAASRAWIKSTLRWYVPVIIRHTLEGILTGEQSRAAYQAVEQVAAGLDDELPLAFIDLLVKQLDEAQGTTVDPTLSSRIQYLRLDLVSCLPYTPIPQLKRVLEDIVARMIMSVPVTSADRSELCQALYEEIGSGLGDQSKVIGYRFWLDWKERLVGERTVKAKL